MRREHVFYVSGQGRRFVNGQLVGDHTNHRCTRIDNHHVEERFTGRDGPVVDRMSYIVRIRPGKECFTAFENYRG